MLGKVPFRQFDKYKSRQLTKQQYFGMGARMALDLGFHRSGGAIKAYGWTPDFGAPRKTISDQRAAMCMWTVVMMVSQSLP
jgi:hypothetical protein